MSTVTMPKKRQNNDLPSLDDEREVEIKESETQTVAGVEWITVRVPISVQDFSGTYMPTRVATGPVPLNADSRHALKALMEGLNESGERLKNGRSCRNANASAIRWLLEQISQKLTK